MEYQLHRSNLLVVGIILAAGESRRMGQPKLLLHWRGEPLICHVARAALEAQLSPIIVVVGAYGDEIEASLSGLEVRIVPNPHWKSGQSASVRSGIQALPVESRAAVFLLGDQPQVPPNLVRSLVETHAQSFSPVIAPLIAGKRGNPVLFDRMLFPALLQLQGDAGGRKIFEQYPPHLVPWEGTEPLLDIDTPADFQKLIHATGTGKLE